MGELIYTIDEAQSIQDGTLLIKIQEAERDGFLFKPLSVQRPLTGELLNRLMTSRDSQVIPFLLKETISYIKQTTGKILNEKSNPFNTVFVPLKSLSQAFKLFAICGKLYYKNKCLALDLFGKSEFYYSIHSPSLIQGWIKTNSQEFSLESCDFIGRGPPHWFIKGVHLKLISTEISWKDFKNAFEKKNRPLEELMKEAEEDAEAPRVILGSEVVPVSSPPLPVLCLKDRHGAFANLCMNYSGILINYHDLSNTIIDSSGKSYGKRQKATESGWEKDLLETDYLKKISETSHYYCPLDKVAKSVTFLLEIGWQVQDYLGNRVLRHHKIELNAEDQQTKISVKGKILYEDFQADLSSILGAFNRRERFAQIAPGYVALLPNNWEQVGIDFLAEEGECFQDSIHIKRNSVGAFADLFASNPTMKLDESLKRAKTQLENFQSISPALPGSSFQGTLRPYQQIGLNWLNFLYEYGFHGLLADDMGLGKTIQVLAFLSRLDLSPPILIVVPTSLIFNWAKEIEYFLAWPVTIYYGSKRLFSLEELSHSKIILTTYTTLRLDLLLLSKLSYACLILDEAQAIKNIHTQIFQAVSQLTAQFRLSITGTPLENSLQELWAHFRFLIPDLLGEEEDFLGELRAGALDPRFLKRMKKKIRPFFLRRKKEEVAQDLPEKIEQIVWVEMSESQRTIYEDYLSGVRGRLLSKVSNDGIAKHRIEILEAIMRLRQICCHPLLVGLEAREGSAESCKLEALLQDLDNAVAEERKVLIYSQFTSMLSLIAKEVLKRNWDFVYLDGSTQNRERVVRQFQEDPKILLFLISLKAGGVGLNLTAADYVLLYDPWWNEAIENQAIDRAHRIGRKDTVIAKRYVAIGTIEERMMKLKASKKALIDELFDQEGNPTQLTADDLLFLLN